MSSQSPAADAVRPSAFWEGKRVLVTGGAGMIGSYLVEELVGLGALVRVADNLERGNLENLAAVRDRIELSRCDLRDRDACDEVTRDVDVVANLAARTAGIAYSAAHHGEMLTANTAICLNVLEAARRRGVSRVLVVSSSCVYPDDAPAPTPELPVLTGEPEAANDGYGWSKRFAELQAAHFAREHGLSVAIVRPFNPYAGRYPWAGGDGHVIPALVKRVIDGESPLVVWGSGEQRRNFVHARDVATSMRLVIERHATPDPVNLGYEDTVTIAELARLVVAASGRGVEVRFDRTKPEGRVVKSADATKLRRIAPDFVPRVSLEEGVGEMVAAYERHLARSGRGSAGGPARSDA